MTDSRIDRIADQAKLLRVPMSHAPHEPEYLTVLVYRIEQEMEAAQRRHARLSQLRLTARNTLRDHVTEALGG